MYPMHPFQHPKRDTRRMDTKEEFVGMLKENQNNMTVKQEGRKLPQYICAFGASIGAFLIGTVLAWTSPSLKFLKDANSTAPVHITHVDESNWIAAWLPIGAIFGALPAGFFADLLGRRNTLIVFTVPWILTWLMLIFAQNVIMIYASRFASGVIVGLFSTVLPLYVNEISEDSIRGSLGTMFQVFLTIGILFDYVMGIFESYTLICQACAGVTVLFLILLFFLPESPAHLVKKNRRSSAEKSLRTVRGPFYDIHAELNEMRKNLENSVQQALSFADMFTAVNVKALTIALGLMLLQQLSGINGVIFFAESIFKDAGASSPVVCTIIMGIVQTLATIVSSILVDKAGRKILLLISSSGMGICLAVFGYYFKLKDGGTDVSNLSWLPLACLVSFIIVFSLGLGPLPWMMASEILAPEIKSFGSGVAVSVNWICVSVVTFSFAPLIAALGSAYTFWMFAVVCIIGALFTLLVIPETKGKSIQEIQLALGGHKTKPQMNGNP